MSSSFLGIHMTNMPQVIYALQRARDRATGQFRSATRSAAEEVMEISKSQYVPYDRGSLRATGRVETVTQPDGDVTHEMKYGGMLGVHYAVFVHEIDKNYNHGRQWKYLETPAKLYGWSQRLGALYKGE